MHRGTQTHDTGDDVDEQIAAYLELAVENDELVRSLISVKVCHVYAFELIVANVVHSLKKYILSCCVWQSDPFSHYYSPLCNRWTMLCSQMRSMPCANTITRWNNDF